MTFILDDYDFQLPKELIASQPLERRDAAKMMLVDRGLRHFDDAFFSELPNILTAGDVVVINNTRVFPARLFGTIPTGARVEIFLVEENNDKTWNALAKPTRRLRPGKIVDFGSGLSAEVIEKNPDSSITIRFNRAEELFEILEEIGRTPLPPYIKRPADVPDRDRERYQTVYAKYRGSIAAPTAGLHFTPKVLDALRQNGIDLIEITLHVGYGTFEPVRVDDIRFHRVKPERYSLTSVSAATLNAAKSDQRRIIAVGTTTTRALETNLRNFGKFTAISELADLTILPGHEFSAVDGLLTNFHLPKSSLLILVSAFAGREFIMKAYAHAVQQGYRFYSYGDCMLIT
ncbi:MAG: tRNA preQ1(34) S-adenosylmethionine ribosyltransferase-isomerase QueA [Blastocatellia bacterium]